MGESFWEITSEDQAIDLLNEREFSANKAVTALDSFSSSKARLDLGIVLKPANANSAYSSLDAWKEDLTVAEIPTVDELIDVIDQSGVQGLQLALALEEFVSVRRFINWIELSNRSSHAVAARATVSIHQATGRIEFLGGTLELSQRGRRFSGAVEKLLPGETLWGLFRTSRPIKAGEIQVIADPTPLLDPSYVKRLLPILAAVAVLWAWVNCSRRWRGMQQDELL